jgi:HEAT repeat protein
VIPPPSDTGGDFAAALRRLLDPASRPSPGVVRQLSSPTPDDLTAGSAIWSAAPVARRQRLARDLLSAAEADFDLDFRRVFLEFLSDPDPVVRATAVDGLWEAVDPVVMARLVDLLGADDAPVVRARAAASLGTFVEMGELGRLDERSAAVVLDLLLRVAADTREPVEVRRRAVESAGFADHPAVGAVIEAAHRSPDRAMRAGALRAMGNSADDRWAEDVLAALDAADPELRFEAAHAAGELALGAGVARLIEIAREDDRELQVEAIWSLGEIGGAKAQRAAERLLASTDDPVLEEALEDALATMALSDGNMWWSA